MDAEQSVDSRKEAELLAELNHEHIVKVNERWGEMASPALDGFF